VGRKEKADRGFEPDFASRLVGIEGPVEKFCSSHHAVVLSVL